MQKDNLEEDFQQGLLVQYCLKFSQYCYDTSVIQKRKVKQYFLRQKFQENHCTVEPIFGRNKNWFNPPLVFRLIIPKRFFWCSSSLFVV